MNDLLRVQTCRIQVRALRLLADGLAVVRAFSSDRTRTEAHKHVHIQIQIRTCIHAQTHTRMSAHMHTCIHAHMQPIQDSRVHTLRGLPKCNTRFDLSLCAAWLSPRVIIQRACAAPCFSAPRCCVCGWVYMIEQFPDDPYPLTQSSSVNITP